MKERLTLLAAIVRSLGLARVSLGIDDEVTRALVDAGGKSRTDIYPERTDMPGPYAIDSARLVLDGVCIECQASGRSLTDAERSGP